MKNIKEKIVGGIVIAFAVVVSVLVLGTAYTFLWESGKAIWKVLTK